MCCAVVPAGTIQLAGHPDSATGLQTLTMTNDSVKGGATQGATIVQYAQGPDGQFFIPGMPQFMSFVIAVRMCTVFHHV